MKYDRDAFQDAVLKSDTVSGRAKLLGVPRATYRRHLKKYERETVLKNDTAKPLLEEIERLKALLGTALYTPVAPTTEFTYELEEALVKRVIDIEDNCIDGVWALIEKFDRKVKKYTKLSAKGGYYKVAEEDEDIDYGVSLIDTPETLDKGTYFTVQ